MEFFLPITLEELKDLSDEEVVKRINAKIAPEIGSVFNISFPDFVSAQFYMAELDRREKRRADEERDLTEAKRWRTDLKYERGIVALIILEVIIAAVMTVWADNRQSQSSAKEIATLEKMQEVLSHLEQSSAGTVVAMNAAKGTMETMNQSLQRQLALYYEISVNLIYEPSSKELLISNNGRTNVTIWGDKFGDQTPLLISNGRAIPPSGAIKTDATFVYDYMTKKFPKPTAGFIPYEIYIKNDKGEKFLQVSEIGIQWNGDVGTLLVQTTAVTPGQWKPGTAQNLIFKKVE